MSQSVESRLFFGFVIDIGSLSAALRETLEESAYDKAYALAKGLVEPPTGADASLWHGWHDQVKKLVAGLTVDYCWSDNHSEEQIWYVSAKTHSIWLDGLEPLNSSELSAQEAMTATLKDFCSALAIPWQTPQWHLVCYRDH